MFQEAPEAEKVSKTKNVKYNENSTGFPRVMPVFIFRSRHFSYLTSALSKTASYNYTAEKSLTKHCVQ